MDRFGRTIEAGAAEVPIRFAKMASFGGSGSSKGSVKSGLSHRENGEGGS